MRQKTADQYDALYIAAMNAAKTSKDYKNAAEILDMKVKVLGLDREDVQVLTKQVYQIRYRVVSLDPESIGLPRANRRELEGIIDGVLADSPDSERKRVKMEAGIIDYDIAEILEYESQAAD